MKKLAVLLIAVLISAGVFAQEAQNSERKRHRHGHDKLTPEQRVDRMVQHHKEMLNLTGDQVEKLHIIASEREQKMEELRNTHQQNREAMRAEMKKAMTERNEDVREILTEEQYRKFIAHQKEMMQKHRERMRKGPGARPDNKTE